MRNRVEILRAIEYTKDDLSNISNLDDIDVFTDKDKEFMEEFKKIYELGLNQLEKFINKLFDEGKELDEYSIQYYCNVLLNGPLGQYVRKLTKDKTYFKNHPDSLGYLGNKLRSTANTVILDGYDIPLGCSVDIYNKLPLTLQTNLKNATQNVETVFRSCMHSSTVIDNTLPLVDKRPEKRYKQENLGTWQYEAHGSFNVKDAGFYLILDSISSKIFDKIKEYLGDETFRLYKDSKQFNPFDDMNDSTSKNWIVNRVEQKGETSETIKLDILGEIYDSDEKRAKELKTISPLSDKIYNLNNIDDQLNT